MATSAKKGTDSEQDQAVLDLIVPPEAKESVEIGRLKIMDQIKDDAQRTLAEDGQKQGSGQLRGRGIELVNVGLSRIEFVLQVREAAFDRAVSLMEAIAAKTIAEGDQRKKEIINKAQAESEKIQGQGKQEANILTGRVRRRDHRRLCEGNPRNGRILQLYPHPRGLQGSAQGRDAPRPDH